MKKFAFDLDGTVTKIEILPLLAKELGLEEEIKILTDLTLRGEISFEKSFRLRYFILKNIPLKKIHEIVGGVELDEEILNFIRENKNNSVIVTGNLDCWIEPLAKKIGCKIFSSTSEPDKKDFPVLKKILNKGEAIRELKKTSEKIIAVGDSFNDISMFEAADISIAFGGVHRPIDAAISAADYIIFDGATLCKLLKTF